MGPLPLCEKSLSLNVCIRTKRSSKYTIYSKAKEAGFRLLLFTISASVNLSGDSKSTRLRAHTSSKALCA